MKTAPKPRDPDATGELVELSADDILESDDIDALEAAATAFDTDAFVSETPFQAAAPVAHSPPSPFDPESPEDFDSEPVQEAAPVAVVVAQVAPPAPAPVVQVAPPAAESSGIEVADIGAFDHIEIEGAALRATQPSPKPITPEAKPVVVVVTQPSAQVAMPAAIPAATPAPVAAAAAPPVKTMMGMPPAPTTSPLPLEESVIISEPPIAEKTLELKGNALAQVAAAAAALDPNAPEQTEVIHRSSLPSNIRTAMGGIQAAAQQQPRKPSSIAPVALDVASMPSIPMMRVPNVHAMPRAAYAGPPPKAPMNHLLVGGLVFAAVALIGLVGIGGYVATRALSDKPEAVATSTTSEGDPASAAGAAQPTPAPESFGAVTAPGPVPLPPVTVAAPSDPNSAPASPVDVSALPSAPAPGSRAPVSHGFTSGGTSPAAPVAATPPPPARGGSALPPPGAAPAPRTASAPAGGATLLPPPAAAPVAAAQPAAASGGTGVIRVDPKLRAVTIDGSWFRANDGTVVVSCGPHRVKAGMNETQSVNVPCGGAVTL